MPDTNPYDYTPETLLRARARECAELRELLTAVAADLERLTAQSTPNGSRHQRCGCGGG